jgi:hypothetical protein
MKSKLLVVIALVIFSLTGCEYFEEGDTLNLTTIEANITALPVLPDSMTYVGWFGREKNGVNYYVKVFVQDANSSGELSYTSDETFQSLQEAQEFILTAEEKSFANDSNLVPSSRLLLSGRFSQAAATLFISDMQQELADSKTVFNLATPTNGPGTNELSGVWFVDSIATKAVAGLKLPELYGGWIYEGWVEVNGQYVSTGRFSDPGAADLYAAYSDSLAGYKFPGEDFLQNAPAGLTFPLDLSNAKVAVSIEYNDSRTHGTQPYLKIFEATIPASAQSGVSYTLQYSNTVLTSGNAYMVVDLVK